MIWEKTLFFFFFFFFFFRKCRVFVERVSICNAIEKMAEHSIHCLQCSDTNGVLDLLPCRLRFNIYVSVASVRRHSAKVSVTSSRRHFAKVLSKTVGNSIMLLS